MMSCLIIFINMAVGVITILIGVIIMTTHYRVKIDFENKTYQEYLRILGFKDMETKTSFDHIEYLFIKKNQVSQTLNSQIRSYTITRPAFDGYLKFSEINKVHVGTDTQRNNLIKKLKQLSAQLNVKIIDYSGGEPVEL